MNYKRHLLFATVCFFAARLLAAAPSNVIMVDLGLPSGTCWANLNIGAPVPDEAGNYFAWGETSPKTEYSWDTYIFRQNDSHATFGYIYTKYLQNPMHGAVDSIMQLEPADDVATSIWGSNWRMPTMAEMQELIDECTWVYGAINGHNGYTITGSNGNSIFLPSAGEMFNKTLYNFNILARYWTSTLRSEPSDGYAYSLFFRSYTFEMNYNQRDEGYPVRAVAASAVSTNLSNREAITTEKPTKTIEYGHVCIHRNGISYTTQGVRVR